MIGPDTEEAGGNFLGKTNADDVVYNQGGASNPLGGVSYNFALSGDTDN